MSGTHLEFGGLDEIRSWGWSADQLAHEIDSFRHRTIKGLNEQCFIKKDFFGELLFENELSWKIIYDTPGNILGFWQWVPLTPAGFEQSIQGQICGERIVRSIVPEMEPGNWYDTYFFSLSICPSIRKSMVAIRFSATIIQSLIDLAKRNIFVNNMSMCFASSYSMLMNKFFLQFDYSADHVVTGKIHKTHLPTFLKSTVMKISAGKNMKELMQLYREATPPVAVML